MNTIKAAVIGCGMIGAGKSKAPDKIGVISHAEAYSKTPRTKLVGVCDVKHGLAMQCANSYQCDRWFTSIEELLSETQPEIVSIATPDNQHFENAMRVLGHSSVRGVLLEKPIAPDAQKAKKLCEQAKNNDAKLAINYSRRYSSLFQQLRTYLMNGKLGTIVAISGHYTKGIRHNGSHWIDLLDMLGLAVCRVQAISRYDVDKDDPTPDVLFTLTSGTAYLHSCNQHDHTIFDLDIVGSKGRCTLSEGGHVFDYSEVRQSPYFQGHHTLMPTHAPTNGDMKDLIIHAVEDLIESIDSEREPRSSCSTAVKTARIIDAIQESIRSQKPMEVT